MIAGLASQYQYITAYARLLEKDRDNEINKFYATSDRF
jgi:hypothetical protein